MDSIGIDIGGMSAKIGVVREGAVIFETRIPTKSDIAYDDFLSEILTKIQAIRREYDIKKIGISSCGLIDSAKGAILYSNNIRWDNKSIVWDLSSATGLPCAIANDAKCAALGEAVWGAGKDYRRMCMITLGTGVGGGFVRDKHLDAGDPYADADGILGHITVENGGRQCTCGRRGCLEAYASATAIMQSYFGRTRERLTAREIFENAANGEAPAVETVEEFQYYLGQGLASLVNVLRPEIIVIGGGVAGSSEMFLPYLREVVNREAYGSTLLPVKIEAAALGNTAGIIGAALL